jgi:hypothetical protein
MAQSRTLSHTNGFLYSQFLYVVSLLQNLAGTDLRAKCVVDKTRAAELGTRNTLSRFCIVLEDRGECSSESSGGHNYYIKSYR